MVAHDLKAVAFPRLDERQLAEPAWPARSTTCYVAII